MPSATVAPLTGQDSVLDELHEMPPRSWTKTARTWLACISHARVCHWRNQRKTRASSLLTSTRDLFTFPGASQLWGVYL